MVEERRAKMVRALTVACMLATAVGCTTVPETGRRQFIVIPPSQEMQLGATAFTQMKAEVPISEDAKAQAMVEQVGRRIAAVAPLPGAKWEFVLFESPQVNAFCLPGGKVGVYRGILAITQTEAGLATVIGHEVAHAVARHGAERMSEAVAMQVGGTALDLGLQQVDGDPRWQSAAVTAYGLGTKLGRELPHSRKQESEADYLGVLYMARAGYDPEEAVKFWERFKDFNEAQGAGGTPWFLRTHPLDEVRIQQLRDALPEAKAQYRPQ